ncbi:MAG TPA: dual specificity protein phosphatase family protein [Gemmataceae bacterium]|nr:dual specificity protein phosphatase family protein [Gemmataceae bacterium]
MNATYTNDDVPPSGNRAESMPSPHGFTWIKRPLLAALSRPSAAEDLTWLREHGIQVLVSLSEDAPRRDWINDAGLMVFHVPIIDMEAPTQEQLERCLSAIERAHAQNMGVAVHCTAGLGRTGTVLAAWFVTQGLSAQSAIARVRRLRPGSVETEEQERAVEQFAKGYGQKGGKGGTAPE